MPAKAPRKNSRKKPETRENLKDRLLLASLPYVESVGFGPEALLQGAADIGLSESRALALFPQGGAEMALYLNDWAVREMQRHCGAKALLKLRVRDRITLLVRTYLEVLSDYKPAVRQVVWLARPSALGSGARELCTVVDAMWRAAGDTSTDYNFYTKRALLAGVLGSTTLRWLADASDSHEATWAFLDSRIENVMQIEKVKARFRERFAA